MISAVLLAAGPAAAEGPVYPQPRSGWHAKQWNKVQEKLEKGDLEDAEKHLLEILDRYPDDAEALTILDRVRRNRRQVDHDYD